MAAEMELKLERPDDAAPRKLSVAEHEARRDRVVKNKTGLDFAMRHDPALATIDLANAIVEEDALRYIGWGKCPARSEGRRGTKDDKKWQPDAKGNIKEKSIATVPDAQVGSHLESFKMFSSGAVLVWTWVAL